MRPIKNMVISGGFGEVATAMLGIINEDIELSKDIENIFIFDTCSEERATSVLTAMEENKNMLYSKIKHIPSNYLRDLDYFLYENKVDTFVHLVAESSQSIFEAIKKVQKTTGEKILYLDASCYLSNFNTRLRSKKFRLHSNWELFDEIKQDYNEIIGATSTGANPGILSNALANFVINGDGGNLGLSNLPKGGFGTKNLKAIYVIEKDSVVSDKDFGDKVFTSNWSPYAALEEVVLEPLNFYSGTKCYMGRAESDSAFDAKCKIDFGDGIITTLANTVQHEECFLMAKKYNVESTFLYTVPETTEKQMNKVKSGEWDPKDLELITINPLNSKVSGTEKLGVMLVYIDETTGESKEVTVFNESSDTHFGTSTHVPYQVAVGVVVPMKAYLQLMDTPAVDYLTLDWGDNHLDIGAFRKAYLNEMRKYLPLQMYIRNTTDGLIKDRLVKDVKFNLINPDKQGFKQSDFDINAFSHEDTYVKYVEDKIYEYFENEDIVYEDYMLINHFILSDKLMQYKKSSEDTWYSTMINDFLKFKEEYEKSIALDGLSGLNSLKQYEDKINIITYEVSWFENMLIEENVGEKAEIVEYISRYLNELRDVVYISEDEMFQEIYNHFHLIMR
jgi:hypothetical protein